MIGKKKTKKKNRKTEKGNKKKGKNRKNRKVSFSFCCVCACTFVHVWHQKKMSYIISSNQPHLNKKLITASSFVSNEFQSNMKLPLDFSYWCKFILIDLLIYNLSIYFFKKSLIYTIIDQLDNFSNIQLYFSIILLIWRKSLLEA